MAVIETGLLIEFVFIAYSPMFTVFDEVVEYERRGHFSAPLCSEEMYTSGREKEVPGSPQSLKCRGLEVKTSRERREYFHNLSLV
jgi:hypothetical protein